MDIPADLKYITPYIQRGQELSDRDPIVSYYAQYYAVRMAINKGPSNKETNAYLSQLLDKLEQVKGTLGENNEAITNDLVGYAHIENFALKVFLNADNEDRAGKASKKTAKTFLAASIFLELLKTFGELDPEVEGKIKYSKWKATDIMKALREGRTPTPGAPGEKQEEEGIESMTLDQDMPVQPPTSISEFPSPPSNFTAPLPGNASAEQPPTFSPPSPDATPLSPPIPPVTHQQPEHISPNVTPSNSSIPHIPPPSQHRPQSPPMMPVQPPQPPMPAPAPAPAPAPVPAPVAQPAPVQMPTTTTTPMVDPGSIAAAQKHAKWAISALNYDDIKTARTQLLTALNDLGYNQQNNFGY